MSYGSMADAMIDSEIINISNTLKKILRQLEYNNELIEKMTKEIKNKESEN